jgi:C4-dicarboxylate-specific signal transduction histidine kinase
MDPDLVTESLLRIGNTVKRIGKIVKGLRSFSRSGENDPFVSTAVEQIVSDTLELCKERFRSQGIALKIGPIPDKTIECRAVQVSQVLLNLLNNALDAAKKAEESWVELAVKEEGEGIVFAVTDSGRGIPPEIAARMMDPFFTTKDVGEGTGLGLSIAKGIVEDHGGSLEYDSGSANTRFRFRIPFAHK